MSIAPFRAVRRLVLVIGWTLLLLPFQIALVALDRPAARRLPVLYHRGVARIAGLRVEASGTPADGGSVLVVANHCSYLDIIVLGGLMPASFVAKSEVAGWPIFGLLARLQRTLFVRREHRRGAGAQRDAIRTRLDGGDRVVLFPEGTTGDGLDVLPFKSALFDAAMPDAKGRAPRVQPVSLAFTHCGGRPVPADGRELYAWIGDMELLPHLWRFLQSPSTGVTVRFHPPVDPTGLAGRKELADHCRHRIAGGVTAALADHVPERAAPPARPCPEEATA